MDSMKRSGVLSWAVLTVLVSCLHMIPVAESLQNCSIYSAIYTFGDSLSDVGNSIAAFPDRYAHAEMLPNGYIFPMHAGDRFCDGKLLTDFMAFGLHRRPTYAALRSIAGDYRSGENFAAIGSTARNNTNWTMESPPFSSPFSLNIQVEWFKRYVIRLQFYYEQDNPLTKVTQALPAATSLNTSLYMVYSGYQDYLFGLYYKELTPKTAMDIVVPVVSGITDALKSLLASGYAKDFLVVNLPPLGCIPAMLTMFPGTADKYDGYGCLKALNEVTAKHNLLLSESIASMRPLYPDAKLFYGDLHGVYTDILKSPAKYNVTTPLKAACGYGGKYNFNQDVTCGYTGMVGNQFVNLTAKPLDPSFSAGVLSWDGIHTSNTLNKAVATDFLLAKHITPAGGLQCIPDFSNWEDRL